MWQVKERSTKKIKNKKSWRFQKRRSDSGEDAQRAGRSVEAGKFDALSTSFKEYIYIDLFIYFLIPRDIVPFELTCRFLDFKVNRLRC